MDNNAAQPTDHGTPSDQRDTDRPALGLDEADDGFSHSPRDILEQIHIVTEAGDYEETDDGEQVGPSLADFRDHEETTVHYDEIQHYFGSWPDAVAGAGYIPRMQRDVSEEDLISELQRIAITINDVPDKQTISELSRYNIWQFTHKFDGLDAARAAAGVDKLGIAVMRGELDPDRLLELSGV